MWRPAISVFGFSSTPFCSDDLAASGKWLVPVSLGDTDGAWQKLADAAANGDLLAVKISSDRLDLILGHHLVCVYCQTSQSANVIATLGKLRTLGISGVLRYKSDRATLQRRDEYLWTSADFEAP